MANQSLWVNAKATLSEEQQWYYLTHCRWDKQVQNFAKDISLKVNVKALVEFELSYFEVII